MIEHDPSGRAELSALLDAELSVSEEADLRNRLATDVGLRLELQAVSQVRDAVRGLAPVDVPEGALVRRSNVVPLRSSRRPARRKALVGSIAAAAAAWVFLVISVAPTPASADPAVIGSIDAHRASIESLPTRSEAVRTPLFPSKMGNGLTLQFVSLHGQQVHAFYASATQFISVFQQPGVIDWEKLPSGGSLVLVDGTQAWAWDKSELRVVVLERDDTVFTFVSPNGGNSVSESTELDVSVLPEASGPNWWGRVTGACHDAARLFALG